MSKVYTDHGRREGGYIISEDNGASGMRSRDRGTLAAGTLGESGMVLARVTASKKLTPLAPAADDGSQTAVGILFTSADASTEDKPVVWHSRDMEASDHELVWPAGITAEQKAAAIDEMEEKGIVVRTK